MAVDKCEIAGLIETCFLERSYPSILCECLELLRKTSSQYVASQQRNRIVVVASKKYRYVFSQKRLRHCAHATDETIHYNSAKQCMQSGV